MMDLNYTKEEIDALKLYLDKKYTDMNQLLISDCETDIALLSDNAESKFMAVSYEREDIIENLKNIKLIYKLILKRFYKDKIVSKMFYRGTNIAEVERFKNEPFIDKPLLVTEDKEKAENEFASKWNRPSSINIKLDSNVPFIYIKEFLNNDSNDVLVLPFTKLKSISNDSERDLETNSKLLKTYNVEIEKQELEELTDRERFGLYNYVLDNSFLIKRKIEECIRLEKENSTNFENIRKLEQLLAKYENSLEENEIEKEYSDINKDEEYTDIDRINKELEELKEISTKVFEVRRANINFINTWKRNIAVYMMAECKEIEKQFVEFEKPEVIFVEEKKEELKEINEEQKVDVSEENDKVESNEFTDTNILKSEEKKEEELDPKVIELRNSDLFIKTKREAEENYDEGKRLLENTNKLILKQQNHAKIAGNIGSNYSALNNAFEMRNLSERLLALLKNIIDNIINIEDNSDNRLEKISKINFEISTLFNYLNNPKIAVRNSKANRFDELAIIEENELKRGIAEKIRNICGEAELKKLKDDTEIIEDKSSLNRFIGIFTGKNKLDEFMLNQIEIRQRAIRKTLSRKLGLAHNYSIHELIAEITMFVDENDDDELVEEDVIVLKKLADELRRNYVVLESKVQTIIDERENKHLPIENKKISKYEMIEIETYRFLNKYGYDIEAEDNSEPKYQDTMASEINRIIEYINSSKLF